jgi:hypothetical protein
MKTCYRCKEIKEYDNFRRQTLSKDGYASSCKSCDKIYYEKNKEKIQEKNKKYYKENKEKINQQNKEYRNREENKEKLKEYNKIYRKENKDKIKEQGDIYRKENQEKIKERKIKYYEENKEKIKEKVKNYRKREENKEKHNFYKKERLKNPQWRIAHRCRTRLRNVLKNIPKTNKTQDLIGCSWQELVNNLENTKVPGKDYTNAHIDHIKPCASFDLTDPEQQKECFHYTNLQFLPAIENLQKGSKLQQLPSKGVFE